MSMIFGVLMVTNLAFCEEYEPGRIELGISKERVFEIDGSPSYWTRFPTSDGVFESWKYHTHMRAYDFKDGVLIGYSHRGRYISADYFEDVRNYKTKQKWTPVKAPKILIDKVKEKEKNTEK